MRRVAVLLSVVILSACAVSGDEGSSTTSTAPGGPDTTAGPETTTTQPEETTTVPTAPASTVEEAVTLLAAHLRVDVEEIGVVKAEAVTWPDSSLGCPEPGELYTQALVDGSQVVLRHGDRMYDYHAGSDGVPYAQW